MALAATAAAATTEPLELRVDLSEAPRRIFHAKLTVPVEPGPLTLYYPKWIPGEHGPTGPIADLAGLRIHAGGRSLSWKRASLDMYTFRVDVPHGSKQIEIALDFLVPSRTGRFTGGPAASDKVAVLSWNTLLLYPAGRPTDEILIRPILRLPPGWQFGTALVVAGRDGERVEFEPVTLTTLVDSPVVAGEHYKSFDLTGEADVPHRLHVVADSDRALAIPEKTLTGFRQLVTEGLALFGARHYLKYDFLLTLSNHVTSFGLEHHESSDNRLPEESLIDPSLAQSRAGLLPHEFAHSWNAKYRRPAGLSRVDYQEPFVDDLLWVYEGLTAYLGWVLTGRSGLWTPEYSQDALALIAARLENEPGRQWRPLSDTARAAQVLFGAGGEWASWRRGVDFYDEGVLIWLEADTLIRDLSQGRRSLDDFCRSFHGGQSGPPEVSSFTYEDLVAALDQVARHDWREFFDERVYSLQPKPPLGGLARSGWKLVYREKMNRHQKAREKTRNVTDLRFSLGITLKHTEADHDNGRVLDSLPGMPAAEAGLAPGMKLVAVNGRRWSPEVLRDALAASRLTDEPIELLVENAEFFRTYRVDYHGGERYPHLVREASQPDVLGDILSPQAGI